MSTAEPSPTDTGHHRLRHLRERMAEHHRRARDEREESSLDDAIDAAAFDLAADIAHPVPGGPEPGYDVGTDLGVDPLPPRRGHASRRRPDGLT
ncbi:hypothetical protein [Streptomyces cinerochromogenes]|uniref:hypothetical protein n=1 Tax=Streptomyces cinerochromogenes TaxID=66422 RepID=UPI001670E785|nr:hypothetical protein [Streptomyces cinerochromogenes]GGS53804.1 hypothetical protein GCM10010206_14360 [Streptomyces cinerochromogenes]